MFGSDVLDVVIGLVFVFLLVSILVTIANELIAALLLSRAKWLRFGILRLVGVEWAALVYAHPMIEGSAASERSARASTSAGRRAWRGSGPSYISSRAFTDVLLHVVQAQDVALQKLRVALRAVLDAPYGAYRDVDTLAAAVLEAARTAAPASRTQAMQNDLARLLAAERRQWLARWSDDLARRVDTIPAGASDALDATRRELAGLATAARQGLAMDAIDARIAAVVDACAASADARTLAADLEALRARLADPASLDAVVVALRRHLDALPLQALAQSIERLPEGKLRSALRTLHEDAGQDLEHFKRNVEVWFNNAMDRVGGWYKRRAQWVVAFLALLAAVGLNIDSLVIVDYLSTHAGVRQALVARARLTADPQGVTTPSNTIQVTHAALHATVRSNMHATASTTSDADADTGTRSDDGAAADAPIGSAGDDVDDFTRARNELADLGLPIGWVRQDPNAEQRAYRQVPGDTPLGDLVAFHLLGWLITALAATVGAPFWFDTLNRIIALRSTGKAPEEAPRPPKVVPQPLKPGQSPE